MRCLEQWQLFCGHEGSFPQHAEHGGKKTQKESESSMTLLNPKPILQTEDFLVWKK